MIAPNHSDPPTHPPKKTQKVIATLPLPLTPTPKTRKVIATVDDEPLPTRVRLAQALGECAASQEGFLGLLEQFVEGVSVREERPKFLRQVCVRGLDGRITTPIYYVGGGEGWMDGWIVGGWAWGC